VEWESTLQRAEFLAKLSLCTAIRAAEKLISSTSDKIDIRLTTVGNKPGKYGVYVNAEGGVQKGAIRLVPIIKGMENLSFKAVSPHAILTDVEANGSPLIITPALSTNKASLFLAPFWMVRRSSKPEEVTVEIVLAKTDALTSTTNTVDDSLRTSMTHVKVPILTNVKSLPQHAELVLQIPEKHVVEKAAKARTWQSNTKKT
jgi:hypothetical protein